MTVLTALTNVFSHPLNKNQPLLTLQKVLWWKWNQQVIKQPVIVNLLDAAKFLCYPNSSYGSFVFYARYPEYEEMKFLEEVIKPKDVCVDVGANVGAVTVLMAHQASKGKIFSFEPTPSLVPKINENVVINNFENRVEVIEKAVANKNGKLSFALTSESEVNHISTERDEHSTTVTSTSLDSFLKRKQVKDLDILKVDVEGAELSVFQGAKKSLKDKRVSIIVFEVNKNIEDFGSTKQELLQYLERFGYSLYQINSKGLEVHLEKVKSNFSAEKTANLVAVANTKRAKNRVSTFFE